MLRKLVVMWEMEIIVSESNIRI